MGKWLRGPVVACFLFALVFLALHAIIPAGSEFSENAPEAGQSAWKQIGVLTGEPAIVFDGSTPISDPSLIFDEGVYKMWYTLVIGTYTEQQVIGIAYAESKDGIQWATEGKHVLSPRANQWDALSVETACVIKLSDNKYYLYYTAPEAPEGNHHFRIGLAISSDGKTWSRHENSPIFVSENEWEKPFRDDPSSPLIGGVLEPSVHYDAKERMFRMWYVGLGKINDEFPKYRIGYATSPDGINWHRSKQPVLEPSPHGGWDDAITSHVNVVVEPSGKHHMFYFGSSLKQFNECESLGGCAMTPGAIGYASSDDGINWNRALSPILVPQKSSWNSWSIGGPSALYESEKLRLWFFGNSRHNVYNARIGTASL